MNKADRKELDKAIHLISDAKDIIISISESEMEKFENLSEGLQSTEKGQKLEENSSSLDEISSELDNQIENLTLLIE